MNDNIKNLSDTEICQLSLEEYSKKIKNCYIIQQDILLPGIFCKFEYLRPTLSFSNIWNKINYFLYNNKNFSVNFHIPINLLTIVSLQEILNLILGLRKLYSIEKPRINYKLLDCDTGLLNLQLLPLDLDHFIEVPWAFLIKNQIDNENTFIGFTKTELDNLDKIINFWNDNKFIKKEYLIEQQIEFYHYAKTRKNFKQVFPELTPFLRDIKNLIIK